jgi:hypothetical protein
MHYEIKGKYIKYDKKATVYNGGFAYLQKKKKSYLYV